MKTFSRILIIAISLLAFGQQGKSQGTIDLTYQNGVIAADGKSWTFDIYAAAEADYVGPNDNSWQAMNVRIDLTLPAGVSVVNSTGGTTTDLQSGGNTQYANPTVGVAPTVAGARQTGTNASVGLSLSRIAQTDLTTTPVRLATVTVYFSGVVTSANTAIPRTLGITGSGWSNLASTTTRRPFGPVSAFVLPVTFTSITGVANACTADIAWVTATEQNSKTYAIEYSTDGTSFTTVGTVASKNSAVGGSYTFSYANLGSATGYFRIKAVDYDGKFAYSAMVSVTGKGGCSAGMLIKVSPNPTTNLVNIQGLVGGSHVSLIDAGGKTLSDVVATGASQAIYLSTYASGVYTLRIQKADGTTTNVKVVKQ